MSLEAERVIRRDGRAVAAGTAEIPGATDDDGWISLSSNDYLGLARHPAVIAAAQQALADHGFGSSGARSVAAGKRLFEDLESRIAAFKDLPTVLVFQSGYAANVGLIPALVGPRDYIVHDELNHASCRDGARLSGAVVRTYRHRDAQDLEQALADRRRLKRRRPEAIVVITDGVFGMEGDIAPLPDICAVADRYGATLVVDEAHATGVLGHNGRGTIDHFGLQGRVDVQVGTLSKAIGAVGGFVGSTSRLRERLSSTSHPILYSSLPPPAVAAAAIAALDVLEREPERFDRLWSNTRFLRERLLASGFDLGRSQTPIIPLYLETREVALTFAARLKERGILVQAATPRLADGSRSRLRLIVTSRLSHEQLVASAEAIEDLGAELGVASQERSERVT